MPRTHTTTYLAVPNGLGIPDVDSSDCRHYQLRHVWVFAQNPRLDWRHPKDYVLLHWGRRAILLHPLARRNASRSPSRQVPHYNPPIVLPCDHRIAPEACGTCDVVSMGFPPPPVIVWFQDFNVWPLWGRVIDVDPTTAKTRVSKTARNSEAKRKVAVLPPPNRDHVMNLSGDHVQNLSHRGHRGRLDKAAEMLTRRVLPQVCLSAL